MKTVIEMAREAGMATAQAGNGYWDNKAQLERLEAMIREDEREACAKLVEAMFKKGSEFVSEPVAAAIRARGEK